jgi:hypothetical protein
MLTTVLADINPGGGCYLRWKQYVEGECLGIYDRWGKFIVEDCGGNFDLTGKAPSQFAASRKEKVELVYVLCPQRGQTNLVADGCP